MAALVAAIHIPEANTELMDGRDKPGHDDDLKAIVCRAHDPHSRAMTA
jgi:hypothetical protein